MSISFATPFAVAMIAAALVAVAQRRLRPEIATQTLAVTCVAAAAAWLWALLAVTLGALAAVTSIDEWLAWCPNLHLADGHVAWGVGVGAGVLLAGSLLALGHRAASAVSDRRRRPSCGRDGVLVLDCDEPAAFAVPGRRGGIVVSRGMIDALDDGEQSVVWAHERAHLRNRHHWYLGAADLAAAALPARTIAKAALASNAHRHPQMAMATSRTGPRRGAHRPESTGAGDGARNRGCTVAHGTDRRPLHDPTASPCDARRARLRRPIAPSIATTWCSIVVVEIIEEDAVRARADGPLEPADL